MEKPILDDVDRAEIDNVMDSSGFRSLMKYMDVMVMNQYEQMILLDVGQSDERKLLYAKLKADGAKELVLALRIKHKRTLDRVNRR